MEQNMPDMQGGYLAKHAKTLSTTGRIYARDAICSSYVWDRERSALQFDIECHDECVSDLTAASPTTMPFCSDARPEKNTRAQLTSHMRIPRRAPRFFRTNERIGGLYPFAAHGSKSSFQVERAKPKIGSLVPTRGRRAHRGPRRDECSI